MTSSEFITIEAQALEEVAGSRDAVLNLVATDIGSKIRSYAESMNYQVSRNDLVMFIRNTLASMTGR